MTTPDLITMIGNLSRSLGPYEFLFSGLSYLIGLLFAFIALSKFKKRGEEVSHHEGVFQPMAYLITGMLLLFLPTSFILFSNTFFGEGNILQYAPTGNTNDIFNSMGYIIRIAGLIWMIRGSVLLLHINEPGKKNGFKGLMFLGAGILALNFDNTVAMLSRIMASI